MDVTQHNRTAWDEKVRRHDRWTVGVSSAQIAQARAGRPPLVLTAKKNVPASWYRNVRDKQVLCLAGGGGQQGPLLAAMGAVVTVFDGSDLQLQQDRQVAAREGLSLATVQGDMRDLSVFAGASFDLIFHPVSNCFVDDIQPVWRECYRVLRPGGALLSGFANPLVYLFDTLTLQADELKVTYPLPYADIRHLPAEVLEKWVPLPYADIRHLPADVLEKWVQDAQPLEYSHSLEEQIAGQLRAGFLLTDLYEDISDDQRQLDRYTPTLIATRAVKPPVGLPL